MPNGTFIERIKFCLRPTTERLRKLPGVGDRPVHPDPAGRVRVVDQLVQLVLLGVGVAPDLGVPDEEQLGLRQVGRRRGERHELLPLRVSVEVSVVGRLDAAVVRDVLSQRVPAVHVLLLPLIPQAVAVVLVHQALAVLLEPTNRVGPPPVVQVAVQVVLAAVVVERVGQLVAGGEPDAAII